MCIQNPYVDSMRHKSKHMPCSDVVPSAVDEETLRANLSTAQKKIEHLTEVTALTFWNIHYKLTTSQKCCMAKIIF